MAKTASVMVSKLLKEEGRVIAGKDLWQVATTLHEEWKGHCCASVGEIWDALRAAHANKEFPAYQKHGVTKGFRTLRTPERKKLADDRAQEAHKKQVRLQRAERNKRPRYADERRQKQDAALIPSLA